MKYLLQRLQEASTWRGIILFVTGALGFTVPPDMVAHIVTAGVSAAGLVGILTKDTKEEG